MSFYDEVLRQLVAAVGGALFLGNLLALVSRRRRVPPTAGDLSRPPLARTLTYLLIGLVVMVWGVASLMAG